MVGDGQVFVAQLDGREHHLAQRTAAVTRLRVRVQVTAQRLPQPYGRLVGGPSAVLDRRLLLQLDQVGRREPGEGFGDDARRAVTDAGQVLQLRGAVQRGEL